MALIPDDYDFFELVAIALLAVLFVVVICVGIGMYRSAKYDPHVSLNLTKWQCTESRTIVIPQTIMAGKTPSILMVPIKQCLEYKRR